MSQDVITSAILIMAAVISVVILVNAALPALYGTTSSITGASGTANDRLSSDIKIIMANADNANTLKVWAKNVGTARVAGSRVNYTDVYYGDKDSLARASVSPSADFRWSYTIDDLNSDGNWDPGETLELTLYDASGTMFTSGDHQIRLVLYNAASFEETIHI